MEEIKTAIWYHANCSDGFCAAWVLRTFGKKKGAEFVPVHYGQEPPPLNGCEELFIVDFSYKRYVLLALKEKVKTLVVLDHHKTAKEELAGLDFCTFNLNKSGGRLAWEWACGLEIPPWLVLYTEDRDLWLWKLPDSKAVNACLRSYPLEFELWDHFDEEVPENFVKEGNAILRSQNQTVEQHVKNASEIMLAGHKVLAVNATVLFSEIAGELAKGRPFGVAWFERQDGKKQYSLRSRDDGVDVAEIAKQFGGGGHRNAAGFEYGADGNPWE